ncbi:MAG TPA: AAA family ATPase, partial [Sorangium sp.]|nr:AAA family ATPase [Sorangium sp.]
MAEAARPRRQRLSLPASRFIGREGELAGIAELLRRGDRLVTVWGPAGMGKTRLALELASRWAEAQPGEAVWLCELTACRDLRAVCGAVARAIGAQVTAGRREATLVERIGRALAAEGRALLVLDNLEQLLPDAAEIVLRLDARILATSRSRLNVATEQEFPVPTLPFDDAAALFTQRARQLEPYFEPNAAVHQIAER